MNDFSIRKTFQGIELSTIFNNQRVHQHYIGYTKKEAIKAFNEYLLELETERLINTKTKIYTIRSNKTGKYLTNLFKDKHSKTFQATRFSKETCYWYNTKEAALPIAIQLNGYVETRYV